MPQKNSDSLYSPAQATVSQGGDELEDLRLKINSLYSDGDYPACVKAIDDNMKTLYEKERWPDEFFKVLRTYQRCYPLLQKSEPLEDRLIALLKKNGIPYVFALLLRASDASVTWSTDYLKNLALQSERVGGLDAALSYSDLAIKLDPGNSGVFVLRGWILDDMEQHDEAEKMYEQAIELNGSNHSAHNALAKHNTVKNPMLALEHAEKAIEIAPSEDSYYATRARILLKLGDNAGAKASLDLAMSAAHLTADYPYQKAEILLSEGKEIAAIALYRKAMGLDGTHMPTLWRLATLYKDSQPELALSYINTIVSHDPKNESAILLKGELLCKLGETAAAMDEFKQLMGIEPKCHEALGGYASLILDDDPEGAIAYYDRAIALAPKSTGYRTGKARAYEKLGQIPQAIKEYRAVIALDRKDARAYGRLGALLADTKPREAVDFFTMAISCKPDSSYYYVQKAEVLLKLPDGRNEAVSCLVSASALDPANAHLHLMLARLLEESGNNADAAEHYKQAVSLDKTSADAFFRLARLLVDKEPEMALLHINSAISLDENNGEYYYLKSKALNALGHNKSALKHLVESLRADGKNPEALNEISGMMVDENPEVSLMYIERAISMSPGNMDYLITRANLILGMSNFAKALSQFEDICKKEPKNHEALFGIGRCLAAAGDDRALEFYNKAIGIEPGIASYHGAKAVFLDGKSRRGEALSAYDAAIALDAQSAGYWLGKAKILDDDGKCREACECYKSAVGLDPDCPDAVGRLGVLLAETSPREALEYLELAIERSPGEYLFHAWKGGVLLALGNPDAAAKEYIRAARLGGETAETYFTLATILAEKLPETALGFCLRSIEADSENAASHLLCGKIYITLEQTGSAIESLKSAVSLDAGFHEPRELLARIFYDHKDQFAQNAVELALRNNPDCPHCLLLKVKILCEALEPPETDELIAILDHALEFSPDSIPVRESLMGLLRKKRSFVRLAIEKRKLDKLHKNKVKS